MSKLLTSVLLFFLCLSTARSQQVPDTLFHAPIKQARYEKGSGPLVLIDEAHHNFHTSTGRFRPFAILLERDGYWVAGNRSPFNAESLQDATVLVISNALNAANVSNWSLPNPSAFTDGEIESVRKWVEEGGSLFLIADHMPFPGCNEKLAAAFGFTFFNSFAMKKKGEGPDVFSFANGRLKETPLTHEVDPIYSFTGQAFDVPPTAVPLLVLDDQFELLLPQEAWQFSKDTPRLEGNGKVQGAYMHYGNGKLVVFGEAAMFTAQISGRSNKMGFNHPQAVNNAAFALRLVHWLSEK